MLAQITRQLRRADRARQQEEAVAPPLHCCDIGAGGLGAQKPFFRRLRLKTEHLPRQARDKYREGWKRGAKLEKRGKVGKEGRFLLQVGWSI